MKTVAFMIAVLLVAGSVWPQTPQTKPQSTQDAMKAYKAAEKAYVDAGLEVQRADLRKNKREIIRALTTFTDAQDKAFWPVYDKHEQEVIKINDQRYAMLKDFAANYGTMTDTKGLDFAARMIDFQEKRLTERKRYLAELKAILPGTLVARLIQLESRTDALIDTELASQIPLAE